MSAKDLFEKYKVKINTHDFNQVAPLISKDCKFWFSSGTFHGLEETQKAFEKTWNLIREEIYTIPDEDWIAESESAAVCTYSYHWAGLINGERREGKGRGTSCFVREPEGWKIVHEHLSPFPG